MEKDNDSQLDLTTGESAQVGEQADLPTSTDMLTTPPDDVLTDKINTFNGQPNVLQDKNGETVNLPAGTEV